MHLIIKESAGDPPTSPVDSYASVRVAARAPARRGRSHRGQTHAHRLGAARIPRAVAVLPAPGVLRAALTAPEGVAGISCVVVSAVALPTIALRLLLGSQLLRLRLSEYAVTKPSANGLLVTKQL